MYKNYKPAKYYDSINFLLNIIMNKSANKNWSHWYVYRPMQYRYKAKMHSEL